MALTLARPRLMTWATNNITDHNRSPLSIDVERIEQSQRMVNGAMRKFVIADKHTFSCSWEMLPTSNAKTVDGFWGANSMKAFYSATPGAFELKIYAGDSSVQTYQVVFSSFSAEITKRGNGDFWSVNVTLEEV
jgi:hypothetical protein